MNWKEYNPEWLAELAEEQYPEYEWLPDALRKCVKHSVESEAYYHFVSPKNANKPGAEWQFEDNIVLEHSVEGDVVLDILKGNRVGGVEFINKI